MYHLGMYHLRMFHARLRLGTFGLGGVLSEIYHCKAVPEMEHVKTKSDWNMSRRSRTLGTWSIKCKHDIVKIVTGFLVNSRILSGRGTRFSNGHSQGEVYIFRYTTATKHPTKTFRVRGNCSPPYPCRTGRAPTSRKTMPITTVCCGHVRLSAVFSRGG